MDSTEHSVTASLVAPSPSTSAAKRRAVRWCLALGTFLVVDIILVSVLWLLPYDFKLSVCFQEQVKDWSLAGSLFDWVVLTLVRDIFMLGLLFFAGRRKSGECATSEGVAQRSAQPLRRSAGLVIFIGVWRYSNVAWSGTAADALLLVGTFSGITAVLAYVLAHFMRVSQEEADTAEAELMASLATVDGEIGVKPKEGNEGPYSSSLSIFQLIIVMRPYFWPSSGTVSEILMYRSLALLTWVCVIGSKSCNVMSPLFIQRATNSVAKALTAGESIVSSDVVLSIFLYAALGLFSKCLKELQSLVYIPVQRVAYIEIANNAFSHLHTLSLDWHLKKKQGGTIRAMQRGLQAAQQTMQYIFLYLFPTIAEAIAVVLVFWFHFNNLQLALFVFLMLAAYIYVTVKLTVWRKQFRTSMAKKDDEMNDRLSDSLTNFETIKYFTAEKYEAAEYKRTVTEFQAGSMMTSASMYLLNIMQQGVIYSTIFGGLWIATARLLGEQHDLGEFVAVNAYIVNVFGPLSFLGTIYNMAVNALIDMHTFGKQLAEKPDIQDMPGAPPLDLANKTGTAMVEFRDVSFGYLGMPSGKTLKKISFIIARGGMMGLSGPTGAGKTTITRLLFRFYDPVSGTIFINGQDVAKVQQRTVRAAIGMVPQDVVMFNSTIKHNIQYGSVGEATQEQIESAATSARLMDFIMQQEKKWDTLVGERGLKLSGGEKQRLAIARCLIKDPPIVVLDEATSALDAQTEQQVQNALTTLSANRTVIAIAHRLSTIKNYNEILVLEDGQIIERGTHDDLLKKEDGKYGAMWHRQVQGLSMDANVEVNNAGEPIAPP